MSKSFSNVIILVFWLAGGFAGFAPVLAAIGVGSILFPLGTGLAVGLLGIALAFGRRAKPFDGLWAPLNLNLLAIFVSLGIVITATLAFGLEPFIASVIGDAMALAGAAVLIALNGGCRRRAGRDLDTGGQGRRQRRRLPVPSHQVELVAAPQSCPISPDRATTPRRATDVRKKVPSEN